MVSTLESYLTKYFQEYDYLHLSGSHRRPRTTVEAWCANCSVAMNKTVNELVSSAPPGELADVVEDLNVIIDNPAAILAAVDNYVEQGVVALGLIASKWNSHQGKYACHVNKKLYNVDGLKAIDIEDFETEGVDANLVNLLERYGEAHYPSTYAFTVVPGSTTEIVIIGQRNNLENYYSGQWKSHYLINGSKVVGEIAITIHYFEEGNVRMTFNEKVEGSGSDVVLVIEKIENDVTLKVVDKFTDLNQKLFKNLRRLLPVTRSKINWGKAIGNYRLGSDVVNKK